MKKLLLVTMLILSVGVFNINTSAGSRDLNF